MNHAIWICMAGVAWLAGCARAEPSHSPSDRGTLVRKAHSRLTRAATARKPAVVNDKPTVFRLCDVSVPGVYAEASPFDGGMGIVITTGDREQVDDLRKLAHGMCGTKASYREDEPEQEPKPVADADEPYAALEEPAKEQPAKEQPAKEQPAKEQPAKERPAMEQPAEDDTVEQPPLDVIVTAQNIDNGILLIVAPRQAKDGQQLAQRIRDDVEELTGGDCPTGEQTIGALTR